MEKGKAKFIDRITGEEGDFYDKFIGCLKEGKKFGFKNTTTVKGDISIKHIYERIKEYNENNEEKLKGATIKEKENKIIII